MLINRGNGCKSISKTYERDLNDALWDKNNFSDYELAWLGVTGSDGNGKQEYEIKQLDSTPLDFETDKKRKVVNVDELATHGGTVL